MRKPLTQENKIALSLIVLEVLILWLLANIGDRIPENLRQRAGSEQSKQNLDIAPDNYNSKKYPPAHLNVQPKSHQKATKKPPELNHGGFFATCLAASCWRLSISLCFSQSFT
jgi:hypothetical protein